MLLQQCVGGMNRVMPLRCGKGGTFQVRFFFLDWRGSVSEELRTARLTVWGGMGYDRTCHFAGRFAWIPFWYNMKPTLLGVERGKWKMDHKK